MSAFIAEEWAKQLIFGLPLVERGAPTVQQTRLEKIDAALIRAKARVERLEQRKADELTRIAARALEDARIELIDRAWQLKGVIQGRGSFGEHERAEAATELLALTADMGEAELRQYRLWGCVKRLRHGRAKA